MLKQNDTFEILTDNGFRSFSGIQKVNHKHRFNILLVSGDNLLCSPNHRIMTEEGWVLVSELRNQKVLTKSGYSSVYDISIETGDFEFFDIVDVDGDVFYSNNILSHNCSFLGSSTSLIDGKKLAVIPTAKPLGDTQPRADEMWMYERPNKDHSYVITVDVSRGSGIDYSAYVVFDVSVIPYKIVARFRDNMIASLLYPNSIYHAAKLYNDAFILVETNDVGAQVADILLHDMEYEHLFLTQHKGRAGAQLGGGLGVAQRQVGLKMTQASKRIGCAALKTLVETDRLIINDQMVLQELSTFVVKKATYAAEDGKHDDLVMCLVMFGWLVNQDYFKDLVNTDVRKNLEFENSEFIEQDMTPFGMIDDGLANFGDGENFDKDFGYW